MHSTAFWLSLLLGLELIADYWVKKAGQPDGTLIQQAIAMSLYAGLAFLFIRCVRDNSLGVVNLYWNVFSTLTVLVMGILIFKEQIGAREWAGIALSLFGLLLLLEHQGIE